MKQGKISEFSQHVISMIMKKPITQKDFVTKAKYLQIVHEDAIKVQSKDHLAPLLLLNRGIFSPFPQYYRNEDIETVKKSLNQITEQYDLQKLYQETIRNYFSLNQISFYHFLEVLRSIVKINMVIEYKNQILMQIKMLESTQINLQINPVLVIYYFQAVKQIIQNQEKLQASDYHSILIAQIFRLKLFQANVEKMTLNHIFTLISLDNINQKYLDSYQGQIKLKMQAMETGNKVYKEINQRFENPKQVDLVIMDRPDFYINLLYFVKRMAIDSKEINDFIESVFISRQKFKKLETDNVKLYNILLGRLAYNHSGQQIYNLLLQNLDKKMVRIQFEQQDLVFQVRNLYLWCMLELEGFYDFYQSLVINKLQYLSTNDLLNISQKQLSENSIRFLEIQLNTIISRKNEIQQLETEQLATMYLWLESLLYFLLSKGEKKYIKMVQDFLENDLPNYKMVNDQSMYNEMNSDIENILKDNNIEYVKEYEVGCRNVDYYLPNKNIIIECDGQQHYIGSTMIPRKTTILRDYAYLTQGYKMIIINYLKWEASRITNTTSDYLQECIKLVDNDQVLMVI